MSKKILVLDDDQSILEVIKIVLNEEGYEVICLSGTINILKKILKLKPDLIFMDIWMSGFDGRDITKVIKQNEDLRNIPVIIISAHTNIKSMAREAGADDLLPKPFDITELARLAKKYIER